MSQQVRFVLSATILTALCCTVLAHVDDPKLRDRQPPYTGPGYSSDKDQVVGVEFPSSNVQLLSWIPVLDFNAGNHTFFLRGTVQDDAVALEPAFVGADPIRTTETGNRGIAVGHSWIVSSRIVNSLRYGYTRIKLDNAGVRNAEFANVRFIDDLNGFDDPGLPGGTASTPGSRSRPSLSHR